MPSIPALPLLALTRHIASFRFSHSHISSIIRSVLAGLSSSLTDRNDSVSLLLVSWASPRSVEEEPNSRWGVLPLAVLEIHDRFASRFSFGPSLLVTGFAYPFLRLSAWSASLASPTSGLLCPLLTSALLADLPR